MLAASTRGTLIDLGAGTGTFAVAAAGVFGRVVAVDVSAAMVEAARAKAAARGAGNVECVQAGFMSYEHAGEPVDAIYTRNALHHLPDFWKALALKRAAELLRPGGTLLLRDLVFSFDPEEAGTRVDEWLAAAAAQPADGWTRAELETHLRDEFSTFTWLLEPMLERPASRSRPPSNGAFGVYARYVCARRGG